jgi:hypothetical protein
MSLIFLVITCFRAAHGLFFSHLMISEDRTFLGDRKVLGAFVRAAKRP